MIEKWPVTIPELSGKRYARNVYVYVPDSIAEDPDLRYPVLYMFDGHNVFFDEDAAFGKAWGVGDYLDATGTELIVVAVECSRRPNYDRLKEYSPYTFDDPKYGHVDGKGGRYLKWLTTVLKPRIDSEYPTLPQRECTFIAGSSMGGLMSLYAYLRYPEVFRGAAALSPSLWTAYPRLLRLAQTAALAGDGVLYLDFGESEGRRDPERLRQFTGMTSALMSRGCRVTARIVPDGEHCEADWQRQLPFLMNTLLYDSGRGDEET